MPDSGENCRAWVFAIISRETRGFSCTPESHASIPSISQYLSFDPRFGELFREKSQYLASVGRFCEKLRFSVVRAACDGRRKSRNINDSGLPTISDNPRGILINLQIALLWEILRLFSQHLSGNGILLEFFTFRRWGPTWRHSAAERRSATRRSSAVRSRCRRGFVVRWPFPYLLPRILRARTDGIRFAGG